METLSLSDTDRAILLDLTAELRRYNDTQAADKEVYMNCTQAAVYLHKRKETISRWLAKGKIEKVIHKGSEMIRKSDLDKLK